MAVELTAGLGPGSIPYARRCDALCYYLSTFNWFNQLAVPLFPSRTGKSLFPSISFANSLCCAKLRAAPSRNPSCPFRSSKSCTPLLRLSSRRSALQGIRTASRLPAAMLKRSFGIGADGAAGKASRRRLSPLAGHGAGRLNTKSDRWRPSRPVSRVLF